MAGTRHFVFGNYPFFWTIYRFLTPFLFPTSIPFPVVFLPGCWCPDCSSPAPAPPPPPCVAFITKTYLSIDLKSHAMSAAGRPPRWCTYNRWMMSSLDLRKDLELDLGVTVSWRLICNNCNMFASYIFISTGCLKKNSAWCSYKITRAGSLAVRWGFLTLTLYLSLYLSLSLSNSHTLSHTLTHFHNFLLMTFILIPKLKSSILTYWHTDIRKYCFLTSCWHSEQLVFW